MRNNFLPVLLGVLLLAGSPQVLSQPQVAASIRPLQLIAMAITDGISTPGLVLDATQDPHHPSLRPSQRRAMDQAEIFLWTGPQLETGMERVVAELDATIITALTQNNLVLHQVGGRVDSHVWLDTRNAFMLAEVLANRLMQLDAANSGRYRDNLARFRENLGVLENDIRAMLDPSRFPPFAVYHDGYRYFENQFGLGHVVSFTGNEEVQPGIRRVLEIREQLEANGVDCIVAGPSQNTVFLNNQLGRTGMHYVTIDVLAHDTALAADGYIRFMQNLARAFSGCHK